MEVLLEGLRSPDRLVQADAARLLGELGRPAAVGPLVDYVRYCRYHCKTAGFDALARIGDRAVVGRIRCLVNQPNCSDDWYWFGCRSVRAAAAVALLSLGDDSGAVYLNELADNDDDVFFAWFSPAILRLPDELAATAALKGRLTVEALFADGARKTRRTEPAIATMIAEALGVLAAPEACERLVALLAHRSRYVRGQAVLSLLAASADESHVAVATRLLDADPTDFVRVMAARALALAGRKERADGIARIVGEADDPFDVAVAVEALGLLGGREHLPVVAGALSHEDAYVRQCAVAAMERMGHGGGARAVLPLRADTSLRVRMQVAKLMLAQEGGDRHEC